MAPLTCGVGLFCVGVMLIFVGTVLLCTLGFTVLLPYHSTSQWVPTTCTTTSSSCCTPVCACVKHATDDVDCLEGFPCVVITVTYDAMRTGDDVNVTHTSTLYRSWADAFFNTCSLVECKSDEWEVKLVDQFKVRWGVGVAPYECYYDPLQPSFALLEVTSLSVALHAIVWPALCLGGGGIIWLGVCLGCCKIESKRHEVQQAKYPNVNLQVVV